jgi:hypothetical protein
MPQRWLHELINIIAFGTGYWCHSRWKDQPWGWLGPDHRVERHDDYKRMVDEFKDRGWLPSTTVIASPLEFGELVKQLPLDVRVNEEQLSGVAHELIDQVWSELILEEREKWAAAFRDVILHPESYPNLFTPADYDGVLQSPEFQRLRQYVASKSARELA